MFTTTGTSPRSPRRRDHRATRRVNWGIVERNMRNRVLPQLMRAATIVAIGAGGLLFLATFAVGGSAAVPRAAASTFDKSTRVHAPMARSPAAGTGGAFAFVSAFEDIAFHRRP